MKVSLCPSLLPFSSPMSSRALLLVLSSLLTILPPFSNSTSHSVAGVVTTSDGNLASVMLCTSPWGGRLCAVGHASPRPPVTPSVFRLSSSWVWFLVTLVRVCSPLFLHPAPCPRGHLSCLSSLHRWLSREVSPLHRALRHRLSAMGSDLHGVFVDMTLCTPLTCLLLPFVFGVLPAGVRTTPPQDIPRHRQGPSTWPFCHDTGGSLMHHLSACPSHRNARTALAHSCGISPPDVPTLARHG